MKNAEIKETAVVNKNRFGSSEDGTGRIIIKGLIDTLIAALVNNDKRVKMNIVCVTDTNNRPDRYVVLVSNNIIIETDEKFIETCTKLIGHLTGMLRKFETNGADLMIEVLDRSYLNIND